MPNPKFLPATLIGQFEINDNNIGKSLIWDYEFVSFHVEFNLWKLAQFWIFGTLRSPINGNRIESQVKMVAR